MSHAAETEAVQHTQQAAQGISFLWAMVMAAGFVVLFGLTQWGILDDVPTSEIGIFAVGTANGIGVIAIGGWNAIGLIAIGGANSIGLVAVGGFNSVGLIAFGGVSSYGVISVGGIQAFGARLAVRIFQWSPQIIRTGRAGNGRADA
ncbi:MAG: hypothetical protein OXG42_01125 [Chloroflexi bacterium]|nr:hypothetical protein [Chloroflexota bacterium]